MLSSLIWFAIILGILLGGAAIVAGVLYVFVVFGGGAIASFIGMLLMALAVLLMRHGGFFGGVGVFIFLAGAATLCIGVRFAKFAFEDYRKRDKNW